MMTLAFGFAILFLIYGAGAAFSGLWTRESAGERIIYGTGLGLGLLAYGVLGLGFTGFLNPAGISGLLILAALLSVWKFRENFAALKKAAPAIFFKPDFISVFFLLPAAAILIAVFSGVIAPETAGDSLCYHLHLPKIYLLEGRISWLTPYEINAYFPFLMEMLYTLGIAIGESPLAKFFHLATGFLASGAIFLILKRSSERWTAALGALLFFTTPAVVNHLAKTYVDIALAAYAILALSAYFRWAETREEKYLVLAGVFSGLMMSVKYLALISILPVGFLLIARTVTQKEYSRLLPRILKISVPAFLFGFIWYLRAYSATGNPVYPYFPAIFGKGIAQYSYHEFGVQIQAPLDFLRLIWHSTMSPMEPSAARPIGFSGLGEMLGPAYLSLLPFIFFARKRRFFWDWLFYAVFFFVFWAFLGQVIRFLFPLLPALAVLISWGVSEAARSKPFKKALIPLLFLILGLHAALAVYYFRRTYKLALGLESQEQYLLTQERSYALAQYINRELPPEAKILNFDEIRMFYIKRPIVREDIYYFETRYADRFANAEEVLAFISRQGFTHILFTDFPETPGPRLPVSLRVPSLLERGEKRLADLLELVYTATFVPPKEGPTRYQLYKIR